MKRRVLIATSYFEKEEFHPLEPYAELYWLDQMGEQELEGLLPTVDCLYVQLWPGKLDKDRLSKMTNLSFVQSGLAGVNHVPFGSLSEGVTVSSNAGGYSEEVGEFAWGLLLSAAKRIVKLDFAMKQKQFARTPTMQLGKEVKVLQGKTLGIAGYGGIGRYVAKIGRAFGMEIIVYSRSEPGDGMKYFQGKEGLERMLPKCDALVLALPLTNTTRHILGASELGLMKREAVLVNIARGEIVDQDALYQHLSKNKEFVYATDVWWYKDGQESYSPDLQFQGLENFIGTPHASGPSAVVGNGPHRHAVRNILRFLKGETPINVVDRREYT
jgi:phosphoglycerate dehydrogenase-like enzyme